jgi:hypothetical protein
MINQTMMNQANSNVSFFNNEVMNTTTHPKRCITEIKDRKQVFIPATNKS